MEQMDPSVIASSKRKERNGQKALYSFLLPSLKPVAVRYLRNNQYVLDVLQESFVKIFKEIDSYDPTKGSITTWAKRIVINTSLNYNKRIIGINTYEIDPMTIPDFPEEIDKNVIEDKEKLRKILSTMPRAYYEIFNLYVIEGFDHDEIAGILEISSQLSRKKLSRARAWLKKGDFMRHIVSFILVFINWF